MSAVVDDLRDRSLGGTVSATVAADPDAVFGAITHIERLAEWNARMTRVVDVPERLEPGAQWVVEFRVFGRTWRSRSRVQSLDAAARTFAYRSQTDDGNPSFADWWWAVEPANGGSWVTVSCQLHPRTFWRRTLFGRIRARQLLRSEMGASLAALAAFASRRTTPSMLTD
jgi:uncharacterized protein YndB with AHSA1/START domain